MHRRSGLLTGVLGVIAIGGAAAHGRLRRYGVVESSMQPALAAGDYVLAVARRSHPTRGDIVVFAHPARPAFELVKRVVGLPGEALAITTGQVHINGEVLAEPWASGPTFPDVEWELGDQVFVLGDSRPFSSLDSRELGPLPLTAAQWRVRFRYWPPARIGRV